MTCQCDRNTWGEEGPGSICHKPFYNEFDMCLICNHDKACHATVEESEVPPVNEYDDRL